MKLHFVNHASFVVEQGAVRLICDPWIEGSVFNDGWELLSRTQFAYEDFRDITHIWFSHEHPDHFNPLSLKNIPEEYRNGITVLFQQTRDKKVVRHCRGLGFKDVRELTLGSWVELAPGVELKCCSVSIEWEADSLLCIRTPDVTLLNLNDCGIETYEQAAAVRQQVGPVHVLTTQFSYAAWQGNADEEERRRRQASRILSAVRTQIEVLQPRWVVPFASFVWFCHEENRFMNDKMNRIGDVARDIDARTSANPIVMYPGDSWEVGGPFDSAAGIERYEADLCSAADVNQRGVRTSSSVPAESLRELAGSFPENCLKDVDLRLVRRYLAAWNLRRLVAESRILHPRVAIMAVCRILSGRAEPTFIFVKDHAQSYSYSLSEGLQRIERAREACDLAVSSDSLALCFRLPWGGETLRINGRFEAPAGGCYDRFFILFMVARSVNLGVPMTWKRLAAGIARRTPLVSLLMASKRL